MKVNIRKTNSDFITKNCFLDAKKFQKLYFDNSWLSDFLVKELKDHKISLWYIKN